MSSSASASHSGDHGDHAIHISSVGLYLGIFAALMVLTALTVWVAFFDLGAWSDVVAMAIAVTKATLVILFFMHVRYSTKLTKLTVISGFVWLVIFFVLLMMDYLTRGVFGVAGK